jgi:hypothetical protein
VEARTTAYATEYGTGDRLAMKITREMPRENTQRTRRVFALIPYWFNHGSNNEPLRTMVWLDYYLVEEQWRYGEWKYMGRKLE